MEEPGGSVLILDNPITRRPLRGSASLFVADSKQAASGAACDFTACAKCKSNYYTISLRKLEHGGSDLFGD